MQYSTKKLALLVSLVCGGLYLAQNYTIRGLNQLRIEPLAAPTQPNAPGGWTMADRAGLMRPSVSAPATGETNGFPTSSRALQGASRTPLAPTIEPPALFPTLPLTAEPRSAVPISAGSVSEELSAPTLRIATFNFHLFGRQKAENPFVIETLAKILRKYEVIAVQGICTKQQDLLPLLVDRINQSDRRFDYMIGPRVGRTENKEQFAFIFDTTRVETDRHQLYSVDDPEDLLYREPLVGWFRSTALAPELAFTFTLVNLHLEAELSDSELHLLPELVRSIHRDGREEDDVILVGDFGAADLRFQNLRAAGLIFALEGVPTTLHGNAMLDNIIMPVKATDEFNGRSGVFDFLRQFNLSLEQAQQVSEHLPVWAEFYANEGGQPGRVQ